MSNLSRRRILFGGAAVGAGALLTACTSNTPQENTQVNTGNEDANPNAAPGHEWDHVLRPNGDDPAGR